VSAQRLACLSVNRRLRSSRAQARATQGISLHPHLARQVQLLQIEVAILQSRHWEDRW